MNKPLCRLLRSPSWSAVYGIKLCVVGNTACGRRSRRGSIRVPFNLWILTELCIIGWSAPLLISIALMREALGQYGARVAGGVWGLAWLCGAATINAGL